MFLAGLQTVHEVGPLAEVLIELILVSAELALVTPTAQPVRRQTEHPLAVPAAGPLVVRVRPPQQLGVDQRVAVTVPETTLESASLDLPTIRETRGAALSDAQVLAGAATSLAEKNTRWHSNASAMHL